MLECNKMQEKANDKVVNNLTHTLDLLANEVSEGKTSKSTSMIITKIQECIMWRESNI